MENCEEILIEGDTDINLIDKFSFTYNSECGGHDLFFPPFKFYVINPNSNELQLVTQNIKFNNKSYILDWSEVNLNVPPKVDDTGNCIHIKNIPYPNLNEAYLNKQGMNYMNVTNTILNS